MQSRSLIRAYSLILCVIFLLSLGITISNVNKLRTASTSALCNSALSGGPCAKTYAFWPAFAALVFSSILLGASLVLSTRPRRF